MAEKIGFVGLGIMGKPMARNLLKAGYDLTVYDIVGEAVEEVVGDGAKPASSSREVAAATDKIITMLPDSADSEKVILGPDGVLEGASSGKTIIDMSSIAPLVSQRIAAECAGKGVEMLDAPVSGGEPGAINATLAIMVGGKQEIFDENFDLLKTMGSNVVLTGDIGAGGVTKLANQIIVAANIEALAEALVLATKAGVDPGEGLQRHSRRAGRKQRDGSESADDAVAQLPSRFPRPPAPEGPAKRATDGAGTERASAGDGTAPADAGGAGQRGRTGSGPLGAAEVRGGAGRDRGQGRRVGC